ncbi:E3 ubiquitin-ligase makorin [Micractinium conductrix]|uniref:E3 ubiquitin-ligase makorin n=1 Tax=Micractinium conductrix TaxID=554055 RepID=A0A2P6VHA7_9CHLO|nr:E3 ubiquitin-ligase makorin [Micractinium conductrix]|eukprot:PSC73474.1 E3 ubiquitin-ligase makorin [Micractinium conductrix]
MQLGKRRVAEWASAARRPEAAKGYVARVVPRPAADDLSQQLPISRLRLGGQAPDSGAGGSGGAASQLPLPIPLPLPADPFGEAGAGAQEASDSWQQHHQSQRQQQGQQQQQEQSWDEPPDYWAAAGEGGEQQWGGEEEGWGGEEEGWGEEAYAEGEEEHWEEGEAGEDGSWPADGGEQGQEQQAWGVPPAAAEQQAWAASAPPSLRSLCMSWFRGGSCAAGDGCKLAHGNLCPHCHKHALHPSDASAAEQHLNECSLRHERLAACARSAAVECGICLEPVLSKAVPADRKFGLLTECDHPFCLHCIRSWRQKVDAGADVDTALRTCPVCRVGSHYIVPSMTWPSSAEEKEQIVAGYRAKLSAIDCMHFNFGEGNCPFTTSCFYRHAYPDGRLEERSVRRVVDDEGVRVVQSVRLCDFIDLSTAGRRLGGGRRR